MARTLDVRRFLGGQMTPQEFHSANAFPIDASCCGCRSRLGLELRAIVLIPYDEAMKRGMVPSGDQASRELLSKVVAIKSGASGVVEPHIKISTTYSCRLCRRAFESALAKAPSWAVIDINRGPDPQNKVQH
jgi:hypothetical protein